MRRWLLWNFHCLRGRRCADVVADVVTVPGDPALMIAYVCGGCRTTYVWNSHTRTRARV